MIDDIGERMEAVHVLVLIVAAGALLRAAWLGADPFWADEGRYVIASLEMLHNGWLQGRYPGTDILMSGQPPVFLYLLAGVHLLGGTAEWAFRAPSVIAGVALLPLVYAWLRHHLDQRTVLWCVAALALSPVLVVYSREAITNMLGLVLQVATLAATDRWVQERSRGWMMATFCLMALSLATHIVNMLLLVLVPLYILMVDTDRPLRRSVLFGVPALLMTGVSIVLRNSGARSETGQAVILEPVDGFLWPLWNLIAALRYAAGLLGAVGLSGYVRAAGTVFGQMFSISYLYIPVFGTVMALVQAVRDRDRFTGFLLAWIGVVAVVLIVPVNAVYTAQGLPIDRGPMFLVVPFLLVTVIGLRRYASRSWVIGLGLPLLLGVQLMAMPLLLAGVTVNEAADWRYDGVVQHRETVVCNGTELAPVLCLPRHPVGYWEGLDWTGAIGEAVDAAGDGAPIYASMAGITRYYAPDTVEVRSLLCNVDHRGCNVTRMLDNGERFVVLVDDGRRAWQLTEQERDRLVRECDGVQVTRLFVYTCPATGG